jgi:hypothetical protein
MPTAVTIALSVVGILVALIIVGVVVVRNRRQQRQQRATPDDQTATQLTTASHYGNITPSFGEGAYHETTLAAAIK